MIDKAQLDKMSQYCTEHIVIVYNYAIGNFDVIIILRHLCQCRKFLRRLS